MKKIVYAIFIVAIILFGRMKSANSDTQAWSLYGPPAFKVEDLKYGVTAEGSDLYTDLREEGVYLKVYETENPICLIQYGETIIFPAGQELKILASTINDEFRIIDQNLWWKIPAEDGAYNLCWQRHQIFLPVITR